MNVKLLAYTPEPERVVALAARLCYSSLGIDELAESFGEERQKKLIAKVVKSGHLSVLEHASFTFAIEGISRVTTHQLVRHRLASYSQQSQRYVKLDGSNIKIVEPKSISSRKEAHEIFLKVVSQAKETYIKLLELGVKKEDARFILPQGVVTKIIVTMNARELFHFFSLRLCVRAQWEIREVAMRMLKEVKKVAPYLFSFAGPPCITMGYCPEENPCPTPPKI